MAGINLLGVPLDLVDLPGSATAQRDCQQIAAGEYCLAQIPLRPGDIVVDIGANVGVVSIFLAKRHPGISVFAYEPMPETFQCLLANIARNAAFNVTPFNLAVNAKGTPLEIHFDPDNPGGSSASLVRDGARTRAIRCPATTLAAIFADNRIGRCRLLKIDCEGGEYDILDTTLLKKVDYLCGEFHGGAALDKQGRTPEKLLAKVGRAIPFHRMSVTGLRMDQAAQGACFTNLGDLARGKAAFKPDR